MPNAHTLTRASTTSIFPFTLSSQNKQFSKRNLRRSKMASTSAVSMAMPITNTIATQKRAFSSPLPLRPSKATASSNSSAKFRVRASLKEKAIAGIAATALTVSMVIPEVAEAAGSGISPSLNNFLLSIAAGGVVLTAILGAVIGVSNFDPVKRT